MRRVCCALIAARCGVQAEAAEQPYPTRPVRLLLSATPGGTVDLVARVLGPKLGEQMGQQFTSTTTPLSLVMWSPLVLIAHPGLGVDSVRDLIAHSKSKELHYASSGNGSGGHMSGELFKSLSRVRAVHVPYQSFHTRGANDR